MVKEVKGQVKIGCGIDIVWKAFAKDLKLLLPTLTPNLVKEVQVIEGDGGLGTVYLFNFGPDAKTVAYQQEKISELDESVHRIAFEVIEGGYLDLGFSYYNTIFQLSVNGDGDGETLIDVTVAYDSASHLDDRFPSTTMSSALGFIKILQNHLAIN